jgi:RNA polymerase primary sigma factor
VGDGGDAELGDLFADTTAEDPVELVDVAMARQRVRDALELLPERERQVLELRFGLVEGTDGISLEQIGKRMGLTRERVRQLETGALRALERRLGRSLLLDDEELAGAA